MTGVLGGAWNLMGPPLVLFLQWSGLDPAAFRATLHAFAFAINAVVVGGWLVGGAFAGGDVSRELALWYLTALLPLALGGWLGGWLAPRVDTVRYGRAVHLLLIVTGAGLVVTALGP